jgi:hypothetical protein
MKFLQNLSFIYRYTNNRQFLHYILMCYPHLLSGSILIVTGRIYLLVVGGIAKLPA